MSFLPNAIGANLSINSGANRVMMEVESSLSSDKTLLLGILVGEERDDTADEDDSVRGDTNAARVGRDGAAVRGRSLGDGVTGLD